MTRLYYAGVVLAEVKGVIYTRHRNLGGVQWRELHIPLLCWRRACAFKMLQGASLQQLLGSRYVVLGGEFLPFYSPVPGASGLRLAELLESPLPMTQRALFDLAHAPPSHS